MRISSVRFGFRIGQNKFNANWMDSIASGFGHKSAAMNLHHQFNSEPRNDRHGNGLPKAVKVGDSLRSGLDGVWPINRLPGN